MSTLVIFATKKIKTILSYDIFTTKKIVDMFVDNHKTTI